MISILRVYFINDVFLQMAPHTIPAALKLLLGLSSLKTLEIMKSFYHQTNIHHNDRKDGYGGVMIAVTKRTPFLYELNSLGFKHHVNLYGLNSTLIVIYEHTTDHAFYYNSIATT